MNKQLFTVGLLILLCGVSVISSISERVTAADGWINVYYPSGGTSWYEGDSLTIAWSSYNAGDYVKIELYKSGNYYSTIASNTSNNGSYAWTIPSSMSSSSYYIKITSLSDSNIYGDSNYFYIYDRSITVDTPSGGEIWYKGETKMITWSSNNAGNYVEIYCILGSSQYTIDSYEYNDAIYNWKIPSSLPSSSSCRIKIISVSYSSVYDYSGYFTIAERSIAVTSPAEEETWYKGETYNITWESDNAGSYVKIELYKNGYYDRTLGYSEINDGSYEWEILSYFSSSSTYQIKITSTSYSSVYDYSDPFSIADRYITVTSPSDGETWYKGETNTITWDSESAGSYVEIELYKYGVYHSTIVSSTDNNGSYAWIIPSSLDVVGSYYQIKITSTSYSSVYDISRYFSIDERSITVTSPSDGETWYKGETYTITWDSDNAGGYVDIELYEDDLYHSTIASSTSDDGYYEWAIPDTLSSSSSYQIKIKSNSYSHVFAYSSGYIIIEEPLLQKWSGPVTLILAFVIISLVGAMVFIKMKKKNISKTEEDAIKDSDVRDMSRHKDWSLSHVLILKKMWKPLGIWWTSMK